MKKPRVEEQQPWMKIRQITIGMYTSSNVSSFISISSPNHFSFPMRKAKINGKFQIMGEE